MKMMLSSTTKVEITTTGSQKKGWVRKLSPFLCSRFLMLACCLPVRDCPSSSSSLAWLVRLLMADLEATIEASGIVRVVAVVARVEVNTEAELD